MLVLPLGVGLLFYFMIFRPQSALEAKRRAMLGNLKKNDRVVIAGGIHGVVASIEPGTGPVTVRVDDEKNVRLKVDRGSITRVLEGAGE